MFRVSSHFKFPLWSCAAITRVQVIFYQMCLFGHIPWLEHQCTQLFSLCYVPLWCRAGPPSCFLPEQSCVGTPPLPVAPPAATQEDCCHPHCLCRRRPQHHINQSVEWFHTSDNVNHDQTSEAGMRMVMVCGIVFHH